MTIPMFFHLSKSDQGGLDLLPLYMVFMCCGWFKPLLGRLLELLWSFIYSLFPFTCFVGCETKTYRCRINMLTRQERLARHRAIGTRTRKHKMGRTMSYDFIQVLEVGKTTMATEWSFQSQNSRIIWLTPLKWLLRCFAITVRISAIRCVSCEKLSLYFWFPNFSTHHFNVSHSSHNFIWKIAFVLLSFQWLSNAYSTRCCLQRVPESRTSGFDRCLLCACS